MNPQDSRIQVLVTSDTSSAEHKADQPKLYVMFDAADPEGNKLYFTEA